MQWVESRYLRPVVVVDHSPAANASCRRNDMDIVQLLRPYSSFQGVLQARLGEGGESHSVRNFSVRFVRPECLGEVSSAELRRFTQQTMRQAAAVDLAYGEQLDRVLGELIDGKKGGPVPSPTRLSSSAAASTLLERSHPAWHRTFIQDYHTLVRCSHFDTMDYPVGVLFAASTAEEGGVEGVLRAFKLQAQRVPRLRAGMPGMDAELHQYYLLIHDMVQGPPLSEARKLLAAVQQIYGHNYCALVKINSVANPHETKCLDPTQWVEANPPAMDVPSAVALEEARTRVLSAVVHQDPNSTAAASPSTVSSPIDGTPARDAQPLRFGQVRSIAGKFPTGQVKVTGCYLSPQDVSEMREVMDYYLGQSLFRFVEKRLRALDVSVQERRTTTLSKVAAWFKSKEEARPRAEVDVPRDGTPPRYLASSVEMQMRRCGDLSMAMHDYHGAVSYYKMCIEELVETLPHRQYNRSMIAGCQEGVGVAYMFIGKLSLPSLTPWYTGGTATSLKTQQSCRLEVAMNDYLSAGVQTYALRLALLLFEFCRTRSPPNVERSRAVLHHVLRTGLTLGSRLYRGLTTDLLASTYLFANPPCPAAGTVTHNYLPSNDHPVFIKVRTYIRFLVEAGALYRDCEMTEISLRCYLRVLEVLRTLGERGCWVSMYESVFLTVSQLYRKLGHDIKSVVMASAAVAQGTPRFSNTVNGLEHFTTFWEHQRQVLQKMGYALCPHMPMPCIDRSSFQIVYNYYGADDVTTKEEKLVAKEAVESEWRVMEDHLRDYYQQDMQGGKYLSFPRNDGRMKRDFLFPSVLTTASSSSSSAAAQQQPQEQQQQQQQHVQHRYIISHSEPLWLRFTLHNPIGGALTASRMCLLYMSADSTEQLWKSSDTKDVTLEPNQRLDVDIPFDPVEPGEYVIIGLCWSLLGQEGYYYFATKQSRPGCAESLYEYAIEHPSPVISAEENVKVTVMPPRAWVTASLDPPLPLHVRDGEYYQSHLVLRNHSATVDAKALTLQRSPQNAHIMWLEQFGLSKNLDEKASLPIAETLAAGKSLRIPLTVRAQHNRGDSAVTCKNYLFFLLGYLPGNNNNNTDSKSSPAPAQQSSSKSAVTVRDFNNNVVRVHRLLRSFEVRPAMVAYSTVLPPADATLQAAAVLTVKHIAAPTAASGQGGDNAPKIRIARLSALHRRGHWAVRRGYMGSLLENGAQECAVLPGNAVTLPLLIDRNRPSSTSVSVPLTGVDGTDDAAGADMTLKSNYGVSVCIPLEDTTADATVQQAIASLVGGEKKKNDDGDGDADVKTHYFMRTSCRGSGGVGEGFSSEAKTISFYVDKGGDRPQTAEEKQLADMETERKLYGDLLERFTPIAISIAWAVVDNSNSNDNKNSKSKSSVRVGELFHFMDPMSFFLDDKQQQQQLADVFLGNNDSAQQQRISKATTEMQQQLCQALVANDSTVKHMCGMVYHVEAPQDVAAGAALPTAALASLRFRCRSLAPLPLLVEVSADSPIEVQQKHGGSMPLSFVGKTAHTFLLTPSDTHAVSFTAHITSPGIVNCNCFSVVATPLYFQPAAQLRTGMSRFEFIEALIATAAFGVNGSFNCREVCCSAAGGGTGEQGGNNNKTAAGGGGCAAAGSGRRRRSSGASALTTAHTEATTAADGSSALLTSLRPRSFPPSAVRLMGANTAALTAAAFPFAKDEDVRQASEAAFKEKNRAHAEDVAKYTAHLAVFKERMKSQTDGSVPYVYRPRVRRVTTQDGSGSSGGASTRKSSTDAATFAKSTPLGGEVASPQSHGASAERDAQPEKAHRRTVVPQPLASSSSSASAAAAGAQTFMTSGGGGGGATTESATVVEGTLGDSTVGSPVMRFPRSNTLSALDVDEWTEEGTAASVADDRGVRMMGASPTGEGEEEDKDDKGDGQHGSPSQSSPTSSSLVL